jgi:acetylornithine deacetylase
MRPVRPADADFVKSALADFATRTLLPAMRAVDPGAGIETEVIGEVAGLVPMPANEARDLVAELTGGNTAGLAPFGTEAGLFQALGLAVVVCGPGHIAQAHKADEYLALDQLQACLDMLAGLDRKLTADG